ncbi:MAG TPA: hypothetical protein VK137_12415, partial [Planctomycetaceae bacterium]|nr:hypothetical protein [Planctomycetaceae bacterium]
MPQPKTAKGQWFHRFLIGLFTVLLTVLMVWLLGFVVDDIGTLPGPDLQEVEKKFLSQSLLDERKAVSEQQTETKRKVEDQRSRQTLLRDSTSRSEKTMNQLVELQRLNAQKGISSEEPQQKALAESVELFLSNQKRDQALSEDIAKLSEQERALEEQKRGIEKRLENEGQPAREEFKQLNRQHDRKLAAFKLVFLLPLLAGVVVAFLKKRSSMYAPLIYAASIAVLWQTTLVIHEHFPTKYFKYIVLSVTLAVVAFILVSLLRMLRFPKPAWLLKQYREAYEAFLCPVCEYPIRRGPRKYLFWTRRTVKKLTVPQPTTPEAEEAYACPACGSQLFEECSQCKAVRHSLLPFCNSCG